MRWPPSLVVVGSVGADMAMPIWCEDWLEFFLPGFERDANLAHRAHRICYALEIVFHFVGRRPGLQDLEQVWKVLRLALLCQDPEAAAAAQVMLPLLWPYFTATLAGDTRNSYVALRACRNRRALCEDLQMCLILLQDLDSAEHLHVWPHLAESMFVVEDILAALEPPGLL